MSFYVSILMVTGEWKLKTARDGRDWWCQALWDLQQKELPRSSKWREGHHRSRLPGKVLKEAQRLRQGDGKFRTHLLYIRETLLQNRKLNPKTQNPWG